MKPLQKKTLKYNFETYSSENSENATFDINMDKKYSILEKNHRRLLGVTTALTEALEYTVRGDRFDLEDTLNHCMAIYPQLFTQKQKKPSRRPPKKLYNTSVSEDVTDNVDTENTEICNNYGIQTSNERPVVHSPITMKKHKLTANDRETLTIDTDNYPNIDSTKSAIFIGPDNDNAEKLLSAFSPATIQTIRISGAPDIYVDLKEAEENEHNSYYTGHDSDNDDQTTKNNISDISPYLIFSPESRRQSLSSQVSDNDYRLQKNNDFVRSYGSGNRVIHELRHKEESSLVESQLHNNNESVKYTKRPKSYISANTSWLAAERQHSQEILNDISTYNQNVPYEITLQQRNPMKSGVSRNNDLMIKIVPEMNNNQKRIVIPEEENQLHPSITSSRKLSNSVQTQTVISTPSETCIIITNQLDPGLVFLSNEQSIHEHQMHKEIIDKNQSFKATNAGDFSDDQAFDSSTDRRIPNHVTIEKLKKLSTGLRVQSDVMLAIDSDSCYDNEKNIKQLDTIAEIKREYSGLGKLPERHNAEVISSQIRNETEKQNFARLKEELTNGSVKERCTILQSLRLKLIHTLAKERSGLMNLYIENDILNINRSPTMLEILMPKEIVNGWDLILQEMILKFLNTMCSMWKGRDYLTFNLNTINCLQGYFFDKYSITTNNAAGDSVSKEMLIAVYHKLSTRQNQQDLLLNSGVAEKVAYNILEVNETMTPYRLRHSLGLLINLCVSNRGRTLLEPMAPDFLKMLVKLLNSKDKKILSYVARILYVLMASEVFHKTAKDNHLGETLVDAIKVSKKRIKLQLEVLKSVIDQPSHHENLNNAEESFLQNIEAELDELEEEVETAEPCLSTPKSVYLEHNEDSFRCLDNSIYMEKISKPVKNQVSPVKIIKKPTKVANTVNENKDSNSKKRLFRTQKSNEDKNVSKMKVIDSNVIPKQTVQRNRFRKTNSKVKHEIEESLNNTPRKDESDKTAAEVDTKNSSNHNRLSPNIIQKRDTTISHSENKQSPKNVIDSSLKMKDKTSFLIVKDNSMKPNGIPLEMQTKSVMKVIEYPNDESSKLIESERGITIEPPVKAHQHPNSVTKSRPTSQANEVINLSNSKRSLFSPNGRLSANDYEYCEDTKQIQTPIQQNNIFRDSRQSPYRSRLNDSHRDANSGVARNVSRSGYISPHVVERKFEMATSSSENELTGPKQN